MYHIILPTAGKSCHRAEKIVMRASLVPRPSEGLGTRLDESLIIVHSVHIFIVYIFIGLYIHWFIYSLVYIFIAYTGVLHLASQHSYEWVDTACLKYLSTPTSATFYCPLQCTLSRQPYKRITVLPTS